MGGAYGTPCNGELQFWSVVQAQMREQSKQLARIADLLAARNQAENIAFAPVAAPTGQRNIRVGDKVLWDDPDGEITRGWEVVGVPEPDDEGKIPEDGVYAIYRDETKSAAEAHWRELIPDCQGGAR